MGTAAKLYDVSKGRAGGRWLPGTSGNPGGRQPRMPEEREARRLLREGSLKAAQKLLKLIDSEDEAMAKAAATEVLKYADIHLPDEDEAAPTALTLETAAFLRRQADKIEAAVKGETTED